MFFCALGKWENQLCFVERVTRIKKDYFYDVIIHSSVIFFQAKIREMVR
jgi:hypothetical protein